MSQLIKTNISFHLRAHVYLVETNMFVKEKDNFLYKSCLSSFLFCHFNHGER